MRRRDGRCARRFGTAIQHKSTISGSKRRAAQAHRRHAGELAGILVE
jgi:hypothetical protein